MSASDPIVAVSVGKRFGRKIVLRDLDLRVPEGTTTALLGRNGAGKSTLLRILTGLLPRNDGEVRVLGMDPWRKAKAVKAATGYVPESTPFHPRWRVQDAIDLSRAFRRKTWNVAEEKRLLEVFALSPRERIGSLSKGFKAKLALLLALAHMPRVILLDEPASGLDPIVRREVLASLVDAIHDEGRTVLLSSHLMEDVERLATRVAFLAGGRIVLEGDLAEVRTRARRVVVGPIPAGEALGELPGRPFVERREKEALLTYLEGADGAADAIRATHRFRDVDVLHMNLTDLFVDLLAEEHEVLSPCAR